MIETHVTATNRALGLAWQPSSFVQIVLSAGSVRWIRCTPTGLGDVLTPDALFAR